MIPRKPFVVACISLLLALVIAPLATASTRSVQPAALLNVSLSFSPNPVNVGSQTQIQVSVTSGGSPPYYLWFNGTIPGCSPSSQPTQITGNSASFPCNPSSTGNFPAHLDVADNAGDHGSTSATLNVQSGGGSGGTGSNGTGGIDLSFLNNLLPIVEVTGFVFLGSTVAIAASAVALAILVPRRLKQIRKALEGEPLTKLEAKETKVETSKEQPPANEL
ncbi:MAG TPA: hypothetical protein VEY12_06400 [Thermoplasmata archaeon]|nr:hypothetical protein [Thermoplasmata archaeon]